MKKLLLRRIKLFALLLFAIVFLCPSCKKDELTAQKLPKPEHVVQKINFDKFRSQVNFNSLGFLKPNFVNFDRTEKLMSIGEVSLSTKLEVYTDTIDKITSATGTSYIFRMPLSSPHAISFRNFTIDVQGGKTKAFIATYFPTKEWISAYKARKSIPFDGTISFAPVNLEGLNIIESLGTIKGNPHEKLMGIGGKTMDYSMCTDYTIYMYTPYGCSQGGHMPWDPDCPWNGGTTPSGEYPGGYSFSSTTYTTCETITTGGGAGGSGSGGGTGGGTTPSPPPGYNPCPQIPDPNILVSYERGTRLMSAPSVPCDPVPPVTPPVYNEYSPIYIPDNFDIEYPQEWYDTEDELGSFIAVLTQEGLHDTDPIPEMYYKNGTGIDMRPATAKNGLTVKSAPRNKDYFWKELAAKRPEMFSPENRAKLALPKPIAPTIDDQWIKYNPTHKAYKFDKLIHHHDEQDYMAYAIPQEVHRKWTKILHDYKLNGKVPSLSGKLNTLISVMQIFSIITDVRTSNPDAWVNWFAQQNEIGKIYPDPANNKYWEIMDQTIYKNSAGVAVRAVVHYNVYADFIWDSHEHRYMGVIKLNEFTEDIDLINKTSKEVIRKWL